MTCAPCAARQDAALPLGGTITSDGLVTATIRKAGVLRYADTGTERIDAAHLGDALGTLRGAPVRIGHGGETVGRVIDAQVVGDVIRARLRIDDLNAREAIASGALREVSPGYDRDLHGDVQRVRQYFEIALVERGRCGASCRIDHAGPVEAPDVRARAAMLARQHAREAEKMKPAPELWASPRVIVTPDRTYLET